MYITTSFDLKLALLQYFRFKRQWVCVYEFQGADIIVDTGKEIIEVETKITKSDLINGERRKARKHQLYKHGHSYQFCHPNKFMFCVPETMVDIALGWAKEINEKYGVIGFDTETFENRTNGIPEGGDWGWHCQYLRIAKSAKSLHTNYNEKLRWAIARRTSAKIASLTEEIFKRKSSKEAQCQRRKLKVANVAVGIYRFQNGVNIVDTTIIG